jgi:isopentenyl-diphosphate delta-isomerase
MQCMGDRKKDHIRMAFEAQVQASSLDKRFYYEPMLGPHPAKPLPERKFMGKILKVPLWVSSITGGTPDAGEINRNLARACQEFGMGMGLGSCRPLLTDQRYFGDFDVRKIIGDDLPLCANLGIAQVEELFRNDKLVHITELLKRLQADGLIIHVNPLQEWLQPEGDRIREAPADTIRRMLDRSDFPIIVKEVGQGMGPESLRQLLNMPLEAIEFAAFGGTNFTKLEIMRQEAGNKGIFEPLAYTGHDAEEMVDFCNEITGSEKNLKCRQLIISGGLASFLDGYYLIGKSRLPAVYGQAAVFLKHAMEGYENLHRYIESQVRGLELAYSYLRIKNN